MRSSPWKHSTMRISRINSEISWESPRDNSNTGISTLATVKSRLIPLITSSLTSILDSRITSLLEPSTFSSKHKPTRLLTKPRLFKSSSTMPQLPLIKPSRERRKTKFSLRVLNPPLMVFPKDTWTTRTTLYCPSSSNRSSRMSRQSLLSLLKSKELWY